MVTFSTLYIEKMQLIRSGIKTALNKIDRRTFFDQLENVLWSIIADHISGIALILNNAYFLSSA